MPDPTFTWSLADTHCVWCGKPLATDTEMARHDKDPGPCCDTDTCWCTAYCWSQWATCAAARFNTSTLELRGLVEAQAAVIARLQAGWGTKGPAWWRYLSPEREDTWPEEEPMTPAEQQVLYGTTSEETADA